MKNMTTDFVDDVVNEIDAKPPKIRLILKWVIRASIVLIAGSFVFGQMKMGELNRLDNIEEKLNDNHKATVDLKTEMETSFSHVNARIDGVNGRINKIYDDGVKLFNQYQAHNQKQLELIIDYGTENKQLLKEMIEISNSEERLDVESQIIQSKINESKTLDVNGYKNSIVVVNPDTKDTTFFVVGATVNFVDNIDTGRYRIIDITKSVNDIGLYDVEYENR